MVEENKAQQTLSRVAKKPTVNSGLRCYCHLGITLMQNARALLGRRIRSEGDIL